MPRYLVPPALVRHDGRSRQEDQREDLGARDVEAAVLRDEVHPPAPKQTPQLLTAARRVGKEALLEGG